ncbi:MAG: Crp/Fnr family transcriptional regulator, partial [Caldilineae bacterium]
MERICRTDPAYQTNTAKELLQRLPYLKSLPEHVIDVLAAVAVRREYPAGAMIFLEGDPTAGFFLVESGVVKISRVGADGREHILLLVEAGGTFNEVAALDGDPNPATATAHTDVALYRIVRSDLERIAIQYPRLAWALLESMTKRTRHLVAMVQDLSMRSVKGRLARLLLEQAEANRSEAVPRLLTQEEMAAHLGTVREMVGRAMRSLAAEGIIEFDRHRIVILDEERLRAEVEGS